MPILYVLGGGRDGEMGGMGGWGGSLLGTCSLLKVIVEYNKKAIRSYKYLNFLANLANLVIKLQLNFCINIINRITSYLLVE